MPQQAVVHNTTNNENGGFILSINKHDHGNLDFFQKAQE